MPVDCAQLTGRPFKDCYHPPYGMNLGSVKLATDKKIRVQASDSPLTNTLYSSEYLATEEYSGSERLAADEHSVCKRVTGH